MKTLIHPLVSVIILKMASIRFYRLAQEKIISFEEPRFEVKNRLLFVVRLAPTHDLVSARERSKTFTECPVKCLKVEVSSQRAG